MFIYNQQTYNPTKYGDESIEREATKGIQNVNSLTNQINLFKVYRKQLVSGEGIILPGFGQRFHEYYHVESVESQPNSDTSIVMRLEFETSSDEIINSRYVYTVLDLLGDIGGLLDMLI